MKPELEMDLENLKVPWTVTSPTHCAHCAKLLEEDEVPLLLFRDLKEQGKIAEVVGIAFHFECAQKRLSYAKTMTGSE